jgi:hypothetical protein
MRQPVREKECIVFRKHALVEDQQELASVWPQTLNRMRIPGREVSEIALAHVVDKDRPTDMTAISAKPRIALLVP